MPDKGQGRARIQSDSEQVLFSPSPWRESSPLEKKSGLQLRLDLQLKSKAHPLGKATLEAFFTAVLYLSTINDFSLTTSCSSCQQGQIWCLFYSWGNQDPGKGDHRLQTPEQHHRDPPLCWVCHSIYTHLSQDLSPRTHCGRRERSLQEEPGPREGGDEGNTWVVRRGETIWAFGPSWLQPHVLAGLPEPPVEM